MTDAKLHLLILLVNTGLRRFAVVRCTITMALLDLFRGALIRRALEQIWPLAAFAFFTHRRPPNSNLVSTYH